MSTEQDHSNEIFNAEETPSIPAKKPAKEKKTASSAVSAFLKKVDALSDPEEKIRLTLTFMREALAQTAHPRMKDFWEGRKLCLELFKANIAAKARAEFWAAYVELSSEAKRVKDFLDEQSSFAVEQLDLAIQALESDLDHYTQLLNQIPAIAFPLTSPLFKEKEEAYNSLQRELNLLNTLASRINSLRKEIVKTEMRLRQKSQFFERLSAAGDKIFPRRKELIKEVSEQFTVDVDAFMKFCFQEKEGRMPPLFLIRDEIKALQSLAKQLTLNTHSFTETRERLSQCWDQLKQLEKERKKEFTEKKQVFKQNLDLGLEKIKAFAELVQADAPELSEKLSELRASLKEMDLGREEISLLKEELRKVSQPLVDREQEASLAREKQQEEGLRQSKEKVIRFKEQLSELASQADQMALDQLISSRDALIEESGKIGATKAEKMLFERLLKQLKDVINERKDQAMLSLSEEQVQSLEKLKQVLEERKQQRQEIKSQLENYRKTLGGSGLDFEKAMLIQESVEVEKARLDKISAAIEEIEEKISEFEG